MYNEDDNGGRRRGRRGRLAAETHFIAYRKYSLLSSLQGSLQFARLDDAPRLLFAVARIYVFVICDI